MIKKCKPSEVLYPLQKMHNYRKNHYSQHTFHGRRDKAVSVAIRLWKEVRGIVVRSRQDKGFISAPKFPNWPWAHPVSYSVGIEINYSGVKAAGT